MVMISGRFPTLKRHFLSNLPSNLGFYHCVINMLLPFDAPHLASSHNNFTWKNTHHSPPNRASICLIRLFKSFMA
jgi:hypothetical protein